MKQAHESWRCVHTCVEVTEQLCYSGKLQDEGEVEKDQDKQNNNEKLPGFIKTVQCLDISALFIHQL